MRQKVRKTIQEYGMFQRGDRVVIGVSGGKDSVCLFRVLAEFGEEHGLRLYVVHVHHGIRGAAADRDAQFTKKLCDSLGIGCRVVRRDVPGLARENGMTVEEAGRIARYEAFYEEARRVDAHRIAVAHHKNDQAETVLMHLFRGTSLNGLKGIRPVSGMLVRPLLFCSVEEITQYLRDIGQDYCTDETNQENIYTRNYLRNQLIPEMERELNPNVQDSLCELAEDAAEWSAYLNAQCDEAQKRVVKTGEKRVDFAVSAFLDEAAVIQKELILRGLSGLAKGRKNLGRVHVKAVLDLFTGQTGRTISLPYGMTAWKSYETVVLSVKAPDSGSSMPLDKTVPVQVPGTVRLDEGEFAYEYCFSFLQPERRTQFFADFPEKKNYGCTKCFDYDRIDSMLVFRHRQPGDYLVLDRDGHRQKLKDFFINEKIPKEQRDQIWVLASGQEIIWIPGLRESPGFFVCEETAKLLLVTRKRVE